MGQKPHVDPVTTTIATIHDPADLPVAGRGLRADVLVIAATGTGDLLVETFRAAGLSVGSILLARSATSEARPYVRAAVKAAGAYEAWKDAVVVSSWDAPYVAGLLDRLIHHRLHREGQTAPWLQLTHSDYPLTADLLVHAPLTLNSDQGHAYMTYHTQHILSTQLHQAPPGSAYERVLRALLALKPLR